MRKNTPQLDYFLEAKLLKMNQSVQQTPHWPSFCSCQELQMNNGPIEVYLIIYVIIETALQCLLMVANVHEC